MLISKSHFCTVISYKVWNVTIIKCNFRPELHTLQKIYLPDCTICTSFILLKEAHSDSKFSYSFSIQWAYDAKDINLFSWVHNFIAKAKTSQQLEFIHPSIHPFIHWFTWTLKTGCFKFSHLSLFSFSFLFSFFFFFCSLGLCRIHRRTKNIWMTQIATMVWSLT